MIKVLDLKFLGYQDVIAAFLVETNAGPVLLETGPYSTFPQLKAELKKHGYQAQDIKHVLLTHIHLDHAGAAWQFAEYGATVHVHPFGYTHLAEPSRLMESAKKIYKEDMDRLWGDMRSIAKEQLKTVKHGEGIEFGGVTFKGWFTPGHASHHVAWQINDELITGDVAGVRIKGGIVVPPCPPPDINVEHWKSSIQLIRDLDVKALYLSHYGKVENVATHLDELEAILMDWANWIKPYWEAGKHPSEVTPLFQAYTAQQLIAAGIEGEGLKQYESANPSWMSVVGLMRYWRKRAEERNLN